MHMPVAMRHAPVHGNAMGMCVVYAMGMCMCIATRAPVDYLPRGYTIGKHARGLALFYVLIFPSSDISHKLHPS